MHKQLVLLAGVIVALTGLISVLRAQAAESSPWISSSLFLEKEADAQSLPNAWNGNIDCFSESSPLCSVPALYGSATPNSTVRLNSSNNYYSVYSYVENKQRFLPIPNSSTAITYTTEPSYGFYFYFNYNFSSSITKSFVPGVGTSYQINRPPDGKLVDKSNRRLAADYTSLSFSANGQWMVVSHPNVAMLRVNLQTFEVLPFGQGFNYTIGVDPAPKTAITNDGRYAVVASKNFDRFLLYDLSTCASAPDAINGPVVCQSRDLGNFMKQQVPGFQFVSQARFLSNDTLSVYATYKDSAASKTARFIISNTSIISQIDYLALGDSYISGEGAFDYQSGTDTGDNTCHLSLGSYPYLIGRDLNYNSYHSVACSGAVASDITDSSLGYTGQAQERKKKRSERLLEEIDSIFNSFKPGYINQSDFVSRYRPKAINLSIGGNDIGFSDIVIKCAAFWNLDNCYESYEDRLELVRSINSKFPALLNTYSIIKNQSSPDSRIYIIGYPQIAKPGGSCALNVRLSDEEARFSELIIDYLNRVIKAAADRTGVYYVDTQDALYGHRLCEAEPGSVAVNGLTAGTDAPAITRGPIGNESYHPNDLGHQLLENKILASTNNLTAPMPAPNPSAAPPSENGLEILDAPRQNRAVSAVQYNNDMVNDVIFRGSSIELNIQGMDYSLSPASEYKAELHSEVITLGTFTANSTGNINTNIQIPADAPIGFHSIHIYGINLAGESIDINKVVYVADSDYDYDGDGIQNSIDDCFFMNPSSQDYDQDGIDDACDGVISQPRPPPSPTPSPPPVLSSEPQPSPEPTPDPPLSTTEDNSTNNGSEPEVIPPTSEPAAEEEIPIDSSQPGDIESPAPSSTTPIGPSENIDEQDASAILGVAIDDKPQSAAANAQNSSSVDLQNLGNDSKKLLSEVAPAPSTNSGLTNSLDENKLDLLSEVTKQRFLVTLLMLTAIGILLVKLALNMQIKPKNS